VGDAPGFDSYEDLLKSASPTLPNPNNLSSDPLMGYFTSGTTGAPSRISGGPTIMSSMCWIMCIRKSRSESGSSGDTNDASISSSPA